MKKAVTISKYQQAFDTLCNRDLVQSLYGECRDLMDGVLLTLHGQQHTARRNIEFKLFRRDFIRYYEKEIYPLTARAAIEPYRQRGYMDLIDFGYRVNMNLTADFSGIDRPRGSAQETEQLLDIVKKFSEGATLFHSTRDKDEVRAEVREAMALFDQVFFQPSKQRREQLLRDCQNGDISADDLPRDVLMILLQHNAEAQLPEAQLSEAMMRREIAFFLQAGAHSTGNSMVHAFDEISRWCDRHPQDRERIDRDPLFLQRCVHESLRLHPASPVAWRTAACPLSLPSGDEVEAGRQVIVDLQAANTDTDIFGADAHLYNPHRQLESRCPPYALTFGIGVHTCFGRDLAGGSVPRGEVDRDRHYLGTLTRLLATLFDNGVVPDPHNPPQRDADTERNNWGRYPVVFEGGKR